MKKCISFLVTCCLSLKGFSQDLNFSQFYKQPLLRNPALCGLFSGGLRVQSVYRSQWQSVTVPYRTGGLSVETKLPFCNTSDNLSYWALGAQMTYDVAGDSRLSRFQFLPVISYHQNLSGQEGAYIIGALMPGFVNSHFDPTNLRWDDQYQGGSYSPTNPPSQVIKNSAVNYFDLGAGLMLTSPFGEANSFYIGAAGYHLTQPATAFDPTNSKTAKLNYKWAFNGGIEITIDKDHHIDLFGDYIFQEGYTLQKTGKASSLMAGGFYRMTLADYDPDGNDQTSIGFGAGYRWDDAFAPLLHLDHHQWSVGLSYDVNVSKLKTASQSRGGFELTLGYRLNNCSSMPCPHF